MAGMIVSDDIDAYLRRRNTVNTVYSTSTAGPTGPKGEPGNSPSINDLLKFNARWGKSTVKNTLNEYLIQLEDKLKKNIANERLGIPPNFEFGNTSGPTGEKGPTGERGLTGDKPTLTDLIDVPIDWETNVNKTLRNYLLDLKNRSSTGSTGIGKDGATGERGPTGADGIGKNGATGERGPTGADGIGKEGPTGADGKPGIGINLKGSVNSITELVLNAPDGDAYIVQELGNLFVSSNKTWIDVGKIQGPPGKDGVTGSNGKDGATGSNGKDGATGERGPTGDKPTLTDLIDVPIDWETNVNKTLRNYLLELKNRSSTGSTGISERGATGERGPTGADGIGKEGATGERGPTGSDGIGKEGATGERGPTGADGIGKEGATGERGPTGADGIGKDGPTGADGKPGIGINLKGSVNSKTELVVNALDGDAYIVQELGNLFVSSNKAWIDVGKIQGPSGKDGATGEKGPTGFGEKGPTGDKPTINDLLKSQFTLNGIDKNLEGYLIDLQNMDVILKNHEGRITTLELMKCNKTSSNGTGKDGATGPTGPNGSDGIGKDGATGPGGEKGPTGADGKPGIGINLKGSVNNKVELVPDAVDGDAYIVQELGNLFVSSNKTWIDVGKIQGPSGKDGVTGATGEKGPTGPTEDLSGILSRLDNMELIVGKTKVDFTINVLEILCNHYSGPESMGPNGFLVGKPGSIGTINPLPPVPLPSMEIASLMNNDPLPDIIPESNKKMLTNPLDNSTNIPEQTALTPEKGNVQKPTRIESLPIIDPIGSIKNIISQLLPIGELPEQKPQSLPKGNVLRQNNIGELPEQTPQSLPKGNVLRQNNIGEIPEQTPQSLSKGSVLYQSKIGELPFQEEQKLSKGSVSYQSKIGELPFQEEQKLSKEKVKKLANHKEIVVPDISSQKKENINKFSNIKPLPELNFD